MYFFFAAGLYYGAYLYQIRAVTNPGFIFAVANVIMFGSYYLGVLSPHLMAVLNARVAAADIYKIIDRKPSIDSSSTDGIKLKEIKGQVEFRNVKFSYPTSKEHLVLNGLSWIAKPGDTIAFVGHSGCGKSTSIGLLTRLYTCNSGTVLIDGINVLDINVHSLRNVVGVVQQEPLLFTGTVKENVRLGNLNLTDQEIIDVCKTANAHDFISKLSEGYDTKIGAGGIQLSGGQKQRIAIARTIARNPKILLLDEATSALDAESEVVVQNALKKRINLPVYIISSILLIYLFLLFIYNFKSNGCVHFTELIKYSDSEKSAYKVTLYNAATISVSKFVFIKENETKGLWQLYKNCHGNYGKLILALLASLLRGMELPAFVLIFDLTFDAFAQTDLGLMMRRILPVVIIYIALGVACVIVLFAAVSVVGIFIRNLKFARVFLLI
ncbi:unnamed protein product [Brugia timori]|uniref:ABC transporter domain-containing protein n=1 Tax=Brugia timori TaxID=42155 RepID=A0A3P7W4S3_9BILA|nr:unnamed protein product [Brugia timori]